MRDLETALFGDPEQAFHVIDLGALPAIEITREADELFAMAA